MSELIHEFLDLDGQTIAIDMSQVVDVSDAEDYTEICLADHTHRVQMPYVMVLERWERAREAVTTAGVQELVESVQNLAERTHERQSTILAIKDDVGTLSGCVRKLTQAVETHSEHTLRVAGA